MVEVDEDVQVEVVDLAAEIMVDLVVAVEVMDHSTLEGMLSILNLKCILRMSGEI